MNKTPVKTTKNVAQYAMRTPQNQLTLSAELRNAIDEKNILTTRTRKKVLSALDDIEMSNEEEKHALLRLKSIQEILSSEVNYLHQLEVIIRYFMIPIIEKELLTNEQFMTLFVHIEDIYKLNGELLNELKINPQNVAAAFVKLAPFFKLYSVYAYDYKNVMILLQELQSSYPMFSSWLRTQETRPEVQSPLSAFLIAPIQRVPRYRLLLKQVLNHTSSTHPDYTALTDSITCIENTVQHIENQIREQEQTSVMLDFQSRLQHGEPRLIKPGRSLIKQGSVSKVIKGIKNNRITPRYLVLMTDLVLICRLLRRDLKHEQMFQGDALYPIKNCQVEQLTETQFKITCSSECATLQCISLEDCESWVNKLNDTINSYNNSRQTLRKDSSTRRPCKGVQMREFNSEDILQIYLDKKEDNLTPSDLKDSDDEQTANCFRLPTCGRKRKNCSDSGKTKSSCYNENVEVTARRAPYGADSAESTQRLDKSDKICPVYKKSKISSSASKETSTEQGCTARNINCRDNKDILYPLRLSTMTKKEKNSPTKKIEYFSDRQKWLQRYNRILRETLSNTVCCGDNDEVNNDGETTKNINVISEQPKTDLPGPSTLSDRSDSKEVFVFSTAGNAETKIGKKIHTSRFRNMCSSFSRTLRDMRLFRFKRSNSF